MASEIVELTVVGIRNYCPGEEKGLPELFDRLPVGKTLFLRINPTGSKYPGSVSVYEGTGNIIGSISKTDRRFIELAIPKDGMHPCKVVGHSLEHNCMYVEAENNVGFKEPYIRQTSVEEGELIFGITEEDERLKTLTQLIQTQLSLPVHDCQELVEVANEYAKICCTSLDGETSFARADILRQLRKVNNGSGVLDKAINKIFEDTKDLGRKYNDVKTTVYRNQYNRIFASANTKKQGKPSELETYIKSLAFRNGDILTREIIKEEVDKLSMQLVNEFMGTFVKASETDEDFATALYSLNYSLRAIYIMYTRRIKREYLLEMLENYKDLTSNSIVNTNNKQAPTFLENIIFNPRIFDSDARLTALRNTIASFINLGEDNNKLSVAAENQIEPTAQNEWYYILIAIGEAEIAGRNVFTDVNFANQMISWFPWLFHFDTPEEMATFKRKFTKSISAERSLWKYGSKKESTAIKDMWARQRALGIDYAKLSRLHPVANGLKKALEELKTEIQKAQSAKR